MRPEVFEGHGARRASRMQCDARGVLPLWEMELQQVLDFPARKYAQPHGRPIRVMPSLSRRHIP